MSLIQVTDTLTISAATGGRGIGTDGPLAVLVHGAGMDRSVWSLQTRWLAHHGCAALAVDLPGHGSSPEDAPGSIAEYADWTAALVTALDRPVHLVSHSMGTFIALETASRADLASVTLIGTAAGMPVHPALVEAAEANDPLAAQLMSGWAFAHSTRIGPHPSPGSSMVGSTQAMIAQARPGVLHQDLTACAAYEGAVQAGSALTVPTTLLLGSADRMTPVRAAQPLIDAISAATVEVIDGSGHMVMIEAPEATRTTIAGQVHASND